ncbi:MAG: DNA primase [Bacilli bacterium]|nr:DNA primase [Bacilli bacterium]
MTIPEATVNKIRDEADIVQVIGEHVKLEKKGNNYLGLCPFHQDNNPSLTVSPSKKIYTCFSCGAKGNVFTFLQNFKNISFVEAVKSVGEKTGIEVNIEANPNFSQNYDKYYKILQTVTSFYEFYLKNSADGKEAQEYLHKRKLNDEIIKRFRIGLAPKDNDLLYQSLVKEKYQPLDMIEAGVIRSYRDTYFDVFRNRLVFPLEDIDGNIVGFSGRIYGSKKTDEPKYLNSGENKIFKKSKLLYNFRRNLNEIRLADEVYVFEGFMDVIAAYRADINNTVATMGTALTNEQILAISKVTKNVILCYDGDEAGIEASKKAIRLFNDAGINIRSILMPDGLDPDDYINKYGKEELQKKLKDPISSIEYLYENTRKKLNVKDINSIENFKEEMFQHLNYYRSNVLSEKFLVRMSEDLQVSLESLQADYSNSAYKIPVIKKPITFPLKKARKHRKTKYINSEKQLIKISYHDKDQCFRIIEAVGIDFVDTKNYSILNIIGEYYQNNDEMNSEDFCTKLTSEEEYILKEILETKNNFDEQPLEVLVKIVKSHTKENLYEKLKAEYKENPSKENWAKLANLKKELTSLKE